MFMEEVGNLWVVNPKIIGKEILIWGVGGGGHDVYRTLISTGLCKCIGFYDSANKLGNTVFGLKVLSREELENLDRSIPVIIATKRIAWFQEIAYELHQMQFQTVVAMVWPAVPVQYDVHMSKTKLRKNRKRIEKAYRLLDDDESREVFELILKYRLTNELRLLWKAFDKEHRQYFPSENIFIPDEEEVFIDGGCLNTLTIRDFKNWNQDRYKKVYAFEPSRKEKIVVDEYIRFYKYRAESVEAGLYNRKGQISFVADGCIGSGRIDEEGVETINIITLDEFMSDKDEKVTFIKLDIEGSELEALEGSLKVIERDHPKLAICVYHKFEDIWEILLWIQERFPKYKFYMRHHSMTNNETVLYARYDI